VLRLPGVCELAQLLADASGAGPRTIPVDTCSTTPVRQDTGAAH
jgi:hypothetical protein